MLTMDKEKVNRANNDFSLVIHNLIIKEMVKKFVIGIDYGTDSVRSVVVDTANGEIVGTSVYDYPRWKKGLFCDPAINQFRQHPLDYLEGLEQSVKGALSGLSAEVIKNIAGSNQFSNASSLFLPKNSFLIGTYLFAKDVIIS